MPALQYEIAKLRAEELATQRSVVRAHHYYEHAYEVSQGKVDCLSLVRLLHGHLAVLEQFTGKADDRRHAVASAAETRRTTITWGMARRWRAGMLHGDFENGTEQWWMTKKYNVMKQYTRAIRPGYTMIDVDHPDAVAFVGTEDHKLVIVQRNATTTDAVYGYDLSRFSALGPGATVQRTSAAGS